MKWLHYREKTKRGNIYLYLLVTIIISFNTTICFAGDVHLCDSVQDCIDHEIDYLIIVADTLVDTSDSTSLFNPYVDALAEQRAEYLSLNVGIVSTSFFAPLSSTKIRNLIRDVYESESAVHMADGHLGFVLLIGDVKDDDHVSDMVPTHFNDSYSVDYLEDHFYTCVTYDSSAEDYDDFPDLMIGRLSVGTGQDSTNGDFIELRGAVNKTIAYDSLSHVGWADTVLLISSTLPDMEAISWGNYLDTLKTIIPDEYSIDEMRGWESGWTDSLLRAAIISSINSGRLIVDGLAHGWGGAWKFRSGQLHGPILTTGDIDSLTNIDEYPVFFALVCSNGMFTGQTDCMAEVYVNADNRGAIAYVAASNTAMFSPSEVLFRSIHRALFNDHAYFMGEMVASGKIFYLSKRDLLLPRWDSYNSAYNYNLFGDPAVNIIWSVADSTKRPDLVVSQSGITISPISGVGDSLIISAIVENKGLVDADTFHVCFYKGVPDSGDTIGTKHMVPGLSAWYGADTLSVRIKVDSTYMWRDKIYVVADCDSQVTEIYEDNNVNWNWHCLYLFPVDQVGT